MSLDLSTLNGGDQIQSISGAVAAVRFIAVSASYVVVEPVANAGDRPFCVTAEHFHAWSVVPPPPLIDPEQVWVEIRAGNGQLYLVKAEDRPDSYLGRQTCRRFRFPTYVVVE